MISKIKGGFKFSLKNCLGIFLINLVTSIVLCIFVVISFLPFLLKLSGLPFTIVSVLTSLITLVAVNIINANKTAAMWYEAIYTTTNEGGKVDPGRAIKSIFRFDLTNMLIAIMQGLKTFVWALLLIIPGIVAYYRYKMAFYFRCCNSEFNAKECIEASKTYMKGNKGSLFLLELLTSIILFLVPIICGILIFFIGITFPPVLGLASIIGFVWMFITSSVGTLVDTLKFNEIYPYENGGYESHSDKGYKIIVLIMLILSMVTSVITSFSMGAITSITNQLTSSSSLGALSNFSSILDGMENVTMEPSNKDNSNLDTNVNISNNNQSNNTDIDWNTPLMVYDCFKNFEPLRDTYKAEGYKFVLYEPQNNGSVSLEQKDLAQEQVYKNLETNNGFYGVAIHYFDDDNMKIYYKYTTEKPNNPEDMYSYKQPEEELIPVNLDKVSSDSNIEEATESEVKAVENQESIEALKNEVQELQFEKYNTDKDLDLTYEEFKDYARRLNDKEIPVHIFGVVFDEGEDKQYTLEDWINAIDNSDFYKGYTITVAIEEASEKEVAFRVCRKVEQ